MYACLYVPVFSMSMFRNPRVCTRMPACVYMCRYVCVTHMSMQVSYQRGSQPGCGVLVAASMAMSSPLVVDRPQFAVGLTSF